ncbi:properdin [Biomphalaria pfeifferi]|uniref:Properdin n=1 Tax=Biomphalaria pfeifferi TaxID=112525 RepID=A0AAD8FEK2_BIOPF|nr:properdin [Biomphalaria pfeifferi]
MRVVTYQLLALLLQVQRSYEGSTTCGQRFLIQIPTVRFPSYDYYNPRVTFLMVTDSSAAEVSLLYHRTEQERDPDRFILKHLVLQSTAPLPAELLPKEYKGHVWTFEFVSNKTDFCLCVHIVITPESTLRWMVLPVAGWGQKYYVVTFHYAPSITVIAVKECTVNIKIRHTNSKKTVTKFGKTVVDSAEMLTILLKRNEAYNLGMCENVITPVGTLTGTYILGNQPIGVVHGSCYQHYTVVSDCRTPDESQLAFGRKEMVSDMAPPVESYGREFITLPKNMSKLARYMALASEASTAVDVSSMKTATVLINPGDFQYIVVSFMPTKISSSKAILLVLVASSLCNKVYLSDVSPALVYIVPVNLYYFDYILCIHSVDYLQHEVIFIASRSVKEFILLDDQTLTNASWLREEGNSDWYFTTIPLTATSTCHQAVMNVNNDARFGCYMFGYNNKERQTGYLLPVSYISSPINTLCQMSSPTIGDLVDNDCDLMIDEEWLDGLDNDKDQRTDEDLGVHHGYWNEWTSWVCTKNCSDANIYRACDNPAPSSRGRHCTGTNLEKLPEMCHLNMSCPGLCPDFKWGEHCAGDCPKCIDVCDKFSGECSNCQSGYKDPKNSCQLKCFKSEFGMNCTGSCEEKCGSDCLESVEGTCPENITDLYIYLMIMPLIPIMSYLIFRRKSSEIVTKMESEADFIERSSSNEIPTNSTTKFINSQF